MLVIKWEMNGVIEMIVVVRKVSANTREEAIGKFVINTADIKAVQKLELQCDELDQLLTIE